MRTGTAEQAIDYACFHIADSKEAINFLRWWGSTESDSSLLEAYPSFRKWVENKVSKAGFTDKEGSHVTEGDKVFDPKFRTAVGVVRNIMPDGSCEVTWYKGTVEYKWCNLLKYRG